MDIRDMRRSYDTGALDEHDLAPAPVTQFTTWFDEVNQPDVLDPNAMVLSTVGEGGRPSSRIVLLKAIDENGLVFFTNYSSRKGAELARDPFACVLFRWAQFDRQVRVEGRVQKVSEAESDEYFAMRPLGSRLGAWASPQSQVVANRQVLVTAEHEAAEKYGDNPPRPPFWGGYRLVPDVWEFWQGRPNRLHDRLRYSLVDGGWAVDRLAP